MLLAWFDVYRVWPLQAPRQRIQAQIRGVAISDWLDQLHASDGSMREVAWLSLEPAKLLEKPLDGPLRGRRAVLPWVRSVLSDISGVMVSGQVVGQDAVLTIQPMAPDMAHAHADALVRFWLDGLSAPLPAALQTCLAARQDGGKPEEAYEGEKMRQIGRAHV